MIDLNKLIKSEDFRKIQKIIFSQPLNISGKSNRENGKITGRKINIQGKEHIQFERIQNNQAFHENIPVGDLYGFFSEKILKYKQADIFFIDSHYMAFNKNGNISFHKTKIKTKIHDKSVEEAACTAGFMDAAGDTPVLDVSADHNRRKNYIINEGDNVPVLIELGIFTKELKIVNSMYGKFKQINRFTELFDDMSAKLDEIYKKYGKINIIDFGCGKSYLTFILYYYFVNVRKYPENAVNMTGVDIKQSVIEKCNILAQKYGYKNLKFQTGDILTYGQSKTYTHEFIPNVVVSLHGCDTATDYALYNAVKWQADIIFAAPCCEHEINAQIKKDSVDFVDSINLKSEKSIKFMRNLLKYGIIKERFSVLLTNSLRCNILELQDYKTELMEFVDLSHSPKNLLIRAVKNNNTRVNKSEIKNEIEETLRVFGVKQTLYELVNIKP